VAHTFYPFTIGSLIMETGDLQRSATWCGEEPVTQITISR